MFQVREFITTSLTLDFFINSSRGRLIIIFAVEWSLHRTSQQHILCELGSNECHVQPFHRRVVCVQAHHLRHHLFDPGYFSHRQGFIFMELLSYSTFSCRFWPSLSVYSLSHWSRLRLVVWRVRIPDSPRISAFCIWKPFTATLSLFGCHCHFPIDVNNDDFVAAHIYTTSHIGTVWILHKIITSRSVIIEIDVCIVEIYGLTFSNAALFASFPSHWRSSSSRALLLGESSVGMSSNRSLCTLLSSIV